ncbi:MAG: hypothetical protein ACRBN8_24255 [Nannocystales bacterium]
MTILGQSPSVPSTGVALLDQIADDCSKQENAKNAKTIANKKKRRTCQKLGQDKHACCEDKIQEHRAKNPSDGKPPVRGEEAFKRPRFNQATGQTVQPVNATPQGVNRGAVISAAIAGAAGGGRKAIGKAIGKALSGLVFPDASVIGPNGEQTFVDFKFACPASNRSKKKSTVKRYRPPRQSARQARAHTALGQATGGGPTITIVH